jgi:hypothetical protein
MECLLDELTRRLFNREAGCLGPVLYELLDDAIASTLALPFPRDRFPHAHAAHLRASLRVSLERETLPEGWAAAGNTRRAGQTFLENTTLGASLRLLSESRVTTNGVPHAGHSRARRAVWSQLSFFGRENVADRTMLLLLDWYREEPTFRIVHPVEPGRYKGKVACDYGVEMIREIDELGNARFDTADDSDGDFFANIEEEETGLDV